MTDKKTIALIIGAAVGVAAVAAAIGVYTCRHSEPTMRDINDVVDQAHKTVAQLNKAVEALRNSAA